MKIPIGISDFKQIMEEGFYYIDKTLLIDELKHTNGSVILIARPRRFGKTLNLSMLKYFYEKSTVDTSHLFEHTAIWKQAAYRTIQGTFPVIFLTFKSCKDRNWDKVYGDMIDVIIKEFRRHFDYLEPHLLSHERADYTAIMNRTGSQTMYTTSLLFLSELLQRYHKKRVMVLIDEYDAPIHAAYNNGYYADMIDFIRALLTSALKDNPHLERGILTGILRTAKEGVFSGLNNLRVCTILDTKFADKFGFTSDEVDQLLEDAHLTKKGATVKEWYNGYKSGNTTIYNPWSLLECIDNKGRIDPYWANTSDNALIKKLIAQADEGIKSDLESLLLGRPISKEIDNGLIFPGIENDQKGLWSLLLFAGYLTFITIRRQEGIVTCTLSLPNAEIKLLYKQLITGIIEDALRPSKIQHLREALLSADGDQLSEILQEFILKNMSSFDIPDSEPERSYHMFVLGLLVVLSDTFEVKSNKESGYGRYDILLIPRDKKQYGAIIEFKKVSSVSQETLLQGAQKALDQINDKQYAQELRDQGVKKIVAFGIGCKGKKIALKNMIL